MRATIFSTRLSLATSNGRMTTREFDGLRMMPVRLTSMWGTSDLVAWRPALPWGRRTLPRLAKCRQGAFELVHLGQGEEEGEGRLGALVPVDPILLEAVAASPGARVVELQAQVVAAEEPLEGDAGLVQPDGLLGGPVGLQAGGDRRVGLDRLLVGPGRLVAPAGEAGAAHPPAGAAAGV